MAGIDTNGIATASMATSLTVKDNVELIRGPGGKHKYMNPSYKRVQHKLYDYTCDVRLKVCEEVFQAHKEVLSQASDYFAAMFTVDMLEKEQDCIELHEISPKGFSSLLEYFYHGHITISTEIVEDILEAARFFHVEWLLDAVGDFLVRHLSIENYFEVLELSDKYVLGDLRANIFHHIGQNFKKIVKEGRVDTFSFELLNQLIADDYYIDASEDVILQTVVDWIGHDLSSRSEHIPALMKSIRFCLVDPKVSRHLPEFITENKDVDEFIKAAQEYHENIPAQCLVDAAEVSVRGSYPVVALLPADDMTTYIQFKVPGETEFFSQKTDVQDLDTTLECASVACLGNFIFVVGGYTRSYVSSRALYRYDPRTISWMQLSDMNYARVSFGLAADQGCLYAVGGVELMMVGDGSEQEVFLDTAEQYSARTNRWTPLPSLPFKCYQLGLTVAGGTIFMSGGVTDNPEEMIPVNYCLKYTPGDDVWTPRSPMLIGRKDHSMTSLNGKIYVIGGSCAHSDVTYGDSWNNEIYDIETDQWTSIAPLSQEFGHVGNTSVVIDKHIFFTSGTFASRYIASYNTESDEYSEKEFCGMHLQKVIPMRIGLPKEFYSNAEVKSSETKKV